jgi:tripartite-type tricarboxylate transporter receptor subunit TctC
MQRALLTSFAIIIALIFCQSAPAQEWPHRPVKLLVPFPAGGNTDGIARLVAQRLGHAFGQQFVVENRPGAAGAIAAEAVSRAPPDGYTLFMATIAQIAITPAITKTSYDPVRDFAPISVIATNPLILVVHRGLPVSNLAEFIAYARAHPGKLSYATAGPGGIIHLAAVMFLKRAGLEMAPVSYRGAAPAMIDVIAGHVPVYFSNVSDALPHISSGALRPLAVTSEKPVAHIPAVPTFIASGFPGFRMWTWNGLMAPANTPQEIVDRIAREIRRAVNDPAFADRLAGNGVDPLGNSPAEFAAMIAADIAMWAEAVKIAGVSEK